MNSSLTPERKSEITLTNIDTSDCGVIALQAITGKTRTEAEAVAIELAMYEQNSGTPRGGLNRALAELGFKLTRVVELSDRYTTATFTLEHEYGTYLIYTDGHVMALINGDCHNSRGQWHAPIEEAFRIEKAGSAK